MKDNEIFLSTSPWVKADFLELEKLDSEDLAFIEAIGKKGFFLKAQNYKVWANGENTCIMCRKAGHAPIYSVQKG